jgi:hypothetical protein
MEQAIASDGGGVGRMRDRIFLRLAVFVIFVKGEVRHSNVSRHSREGGNLMLLESCWEI